MKILLVLAALTVGPAVTPTPRAESAFAEAKAAVYLCAVQYVQSQPFYRTPQELNTLLVRAMAFCRPVAQEMIRAYNDYHGDGGETYFAGRFLDELPGTAIRLLSKRANP